MTFRSVSVMALVAVSIVLAGCSVQEPPAEVTPSVTAVDTSGWETISLSGSSSLSNQTFEIPSEARSIDLTVACAQGSVVFVSSGDPADPMATPGAEAWCGSVTTQRLPLVETPRILRLSVGVPDGATFAITGEFSTEQATSPDPAVEADCKRYFDLYSAVYNADDGFRLGLTSPEDWANQIAIAGRDASALDADSSEIMALQLPAIVATLNRTDLVPGSLTGVLGIERIPEFSAATNIFQQVCNRNGNALTIMAQYGG
ncbi:hypothetical protein HD599_000734 [Conyzicola lurida]|uniref:Lipoprotein n=1 Tax=Conyzicola lurida TaxID=1172621 RepID=A0A841AL22_9MICO|nr:hypothetical protein [Conyzicola lurida]MBB5842411.1 hypothetical protein [Conyzicola lurida]